MKLHSGLVAAVVGLGLLLSAPAEAGKRNRAWATCLFRAHLAMHESVSRTGGESKHWFERVEFDSRTEAQEKVPKSLSH